MHRRAVLAFIVIGIASSRAHAQAPNADPTYRSGANHHLGDDTFVATYGHAPTSADEQLRIHTHFLAVRAMLAARPATKPELEPRRRQLLGYFDDYIAKGTTPQNAHLPWRTPVFIDDAGTICAVGYLLQQSAGRAVAERVAATHRYAYLEEIAAAMPDVAAWVAASGFTLEELSSIQPGYAAPIEETWQPWNLAADKPEDGPYDKDGVMGTIAHGHMVGTWTRQDDHGHVLGTGELHAGAGRWTSFYLDGKPLAIGTFAGDRPSGGWRFFHPSGRLAADGSFRNGHRSGRWRFYYDTDAHTPIATGAFADGMVSGTWNHYDAHGALLATSTDATPREWKNGSSGGYLLDIVVGKDGVRHEVHQGNVAGDHHRMDLLAAGGELLYVPSQGDGIYDGSGHKLVHDDALGWTAAACHWSAAERRAAKAGALARFHGLWDGNGMGDEQPEVCDAPAPISAARGHRIDALLKSIEATRAQSPEFVRHLVLGDVTPADMAPDPNDDAAVQAAKRAQWDGAIHDADDLAKVLAANMSWYIEWPHVDGQFIAVYETLPGYSSQGQ